MAECSLVEGNCNSGTSAYTPCVHDLGAIVGRQLVVIHCDNQAVVSVVNSGYSKDEDITHLMHDLFFVRAYWGFELHGGHIPGEENATADAISHSNVHVFSQVASDALPQATPVPPTILKLLVTLRPDRASPSWTTLFKSCLQQVWPMQPSEDTDLVRGGTLSSVGQTTFHRSQRQSQPSQPL